MAGLTPAQLAALKQSSQSAGEKINSGSFAPSWTLTGSKALVQAGQSVVVRLCPRWDIAESVIPDPADPKKRIPNPAYDADALDFVYALEHWWMDEEGKWHHEWSPKTTDKAAEDPIEEAAIDLEKSGDKDIRASGKKLRAKGVYLYNVVVGFPRRRNQAGQADIRYIALSPVLHKAICDLKTGGDNPQFGRGAIENHKDGYDLVLKRPAKDSGERWTVTIATDSSALVDDSATFKGWHLRLINLPEMLQSEMKSAEELFKAYHGYDREAEAASVPPAGAPARVEAPAEAEDGFGGADPAGEDFAAVQEAQSAPVSAPAAPSAPQATDPDDEFMPGGNVAPRPGAATKPGPGARPGGAPRAPRR
jgi:hypothetical protein